MLDLKIYGILESQPGTNIDSCARHAENTVIYVSPKGRLPRLARKIFPIFGEWFMKRLANRIASESDIIPKSYEAFLLLYEQDQQKVTVIDKILEDRIVEE